MGGKAAAQGGEQRVVVAGGQAFDGLGADFEAVGVVARFAAERVRQQLVALAQPEQRQAVFVGLSQPAGGTLAPIGFVAHHFVRAGDHGGGAA